MVNTILQTKFNNKVKGSYTIMQWDLLQGYTFNTCTSLSVLHHTEMTIEKHMITSIDGQDAFGKIQHPFMIKTKKWV